MTLYTIAVTLILVMDPLGNIPVFLAVLKDVDANRRKLVILRENLFAFLILATFLFFGASILHGLNIAESALSVAGGIILFLIAIRMIFPTEEGRFGDPGMGEPFVVPLAIPMIAGPSSIATVLLFASQHPTNKIEAFFALVIASCFCTALFLASNYLRKILGAKGLIAIERLMGMLLTTIAVQMFLSGLQGYLKLSGSA
jgi:multiple antibiotic resistance protein